MKTTRKKKSEMNRKIWILMLCVVLALTQLAACGGSDTEANVEIDPNANVETIGFEEVPLINQPEESTVLTPSAPGTTVYKNSKATIDASNISQGYIMAQYEGKNAKIKVQLTKKGCETYTYNLNARDAYEVFPLSEGSGSYTIKVFENISGNKYSQAFSKTFDVKLANEFLPFLYPNQYVNYSATSETVKKGVEITKDATTDLEVVATVYDYVVDNFTYDKNKAATVKSGYLPDVDTILSSKKGICFDYAAVMASMLRTQNVPSKLVVGYTGKVYHAWINVYIEGQGWVDGMIFFNGTKWELMDPTFASSGKRSEAIMKYIGDASNYKQKYVY